MKQNISKIERKFDLLFTYILTNVLKYLCILQNQVILNLSNKRNKFTLTLHIKIIT